MSGPLTTNLDEESGVPYFLWDDPMTVRELVDHLRESEPRERFRMLGKILREARDRDVWRFTTPAEVDREWDSIAPNLGRRRAYWRWLLDGWRRDGMLRG